MEIYQTIEGESQFVDVYYAELKDGSVAVKYDLDKTFVKVITKSKWDKMVADAKSKGKEVRALNFTQ